MQHAQSATGEESKTKTLQRVKVQHQIVQYIKRVQHENITTQKVEHANGAIWKKCNMKRVQYRKKCNMKKYKFP